MITIGMNYNVIEGKGQIFEDACSKVVETMDGMEGHDQSEIFRRCGEGGPVYLILSRWSSEDAFNDFIASDAFKKVTDWGKNNILSARPQHTTYHQGDDA